MYNRPPFGFPRGTIDSLHPYVIQLLKDDGQPDPVPKIDRYMDELEVSNSPFRKKVAAGEIVASPFKKVEIKVTRNPALPVTYRDYGWYNVISSFALLAKFIGDPVRDFDGLVDSLGNPAPPITGAIAWEGEGVAGLTNVWFSGSIYTNAYDFIFTDPGTNVFVSDLDMNRVLYSLRSEFDRFNTVLHTKNLGKANVGAVDALTNFAELPMTVEYLFDILKQIGNILIDIKKKQIKLYQPKADVPYPRKLRGMKDSEYRKKVYDFHKTKRFQKRELADAAASLRAQAEYAIAPLAYAFEDALKFIDSIARPFAAFREVSLSQLDPPYVPNSVASGKINMAQNSWIKRSYAISDYITAVVSNCAIAPLLTAFELTPFLGIVLDWFWNCVDYLSAMSSSTYLDQKVTFSNKLDGTIDYVVVYGAQTPTMLVEVDGYQRNLINTPIALAELCSNVELDLRKVINGAALGWLFYRSQLSGLKVHSTSVV